MSLVSTVICVCLPISLLNASCYSISSFNRRWIFPSPMALLCVLEAVLLVISAALEF